MTSGRYKKNYGPFLVANFIYYEGMADSLNLNFQKDQKALTTVIKMN